MYLSIYICSLVSIFGRHFLYFIVKPTYDDLLAKGYIKIAKILLHCFHGILLQAFGENRILIAPIKELRRVKAKLMEYKEKGAQPPYAACVCDFLRATVLCKSLDDMVDTLVRFVYFFSSFVVTLLFVC